MRQFNRVPILSFLGFAVLAFVTFASSTPASADPLYACEEEFTSLIGSAQAAYSGSLVVQEANADLSDLSDVVVDYNLLAEQRLCNYLQTGSGVYLDQYEDAIDDAEDALMNASGATLTLSGAVANEGLQMEAFDDDLHLFAAAFSDATGTGQLTFGYGTWIYMASGAVVPRASYLCTASGPEACAQKKAALDAAKAAEKMAWDARTQAEKNWEKLVNDAEDIKKEVVVKLFLLGKLPANATVQQITAYNEQLRDIIWRRDQGLIMESFEKTYYDVYRTQRDSWFQKGDLLKTAQKEYDDCLKANPV
jgi:hypothetical protein